MSQLSQASIRARRDRERAQRAAAAAARVAGAREPVRQLMVVVERDDLDALRREEAARVAAARAAAAAAAVPVVEGDVPRPAPPPQAPPRRRHAEVPHRVTYRRAINVTPAELERLCGRPHFCGPFIDVCRYCGAKYFTKEPQSRDEIRIKCCKRGEVELPALRCPDELRALYMGVGPRSVRFLTNSRAANSLFAMGSFKTSTPAQRLEGHHWSFTVCGQIYHFTMGVPGTQELREPILHHFYFLDIDEVMQRRNELLEDRVDRETLTAIEGVLRRDNRYIRAFQMMGEVLREERARRGERPADVVIGFCRAGDMNVMRRQYELPESRSEIAAVFYGMEPPFNVDLRLYPRRGDDGEERHHELKNLNPMADLMVYPLLFPYGEDGYAVGMRHGTHKISMREFYRYRIQVRDVFSLLHNGR